MDIEAVTNYQTISAKLAKLTEEQFERFCNNFNVEEKEVFCKMRTLHKIMTDKQFYNSVEKAVAKELYETFNQ